MTRRVIIGLLALLGTSLLAGASVFAYGGHGDRHRIAKRFVSAAIDDALDEARVTPEQRTAIYGARDRVFAAIEDHRKRHGAYLEETLKLFEADRPGREQVEALRRQAEEERQKIADVIHQALLEVHDVLTPEQRKTVADYVRSHRWRHRE